MMLAILAIGIYLFSFGLTIRVTDRKFMSSLYFKVTPALCGLFLILYAIFNMVGVTIPA